MTFHDLIHNSLSYDQVIQPSLIAFRPELVLCATIVAMLLVKMFRGRGTNAVYVMWLGTFIALLISLRGNDLDKPSEIFTGMLVCDTFGIYMRRLLLLFALLFATFTQISGIPQRRHSTEFFTLILGAILGMCLMVSANHMLIVFLGVEMASVPSYVLVGIIKKRREGAEAALKFAVFGAGAAGVMLYGISLLVGTLGSAHLPTMSVRLAELLGSSAVDPRSLVLMLAGLMVGVGLAFKLSAVPFHFWAPDVFEGAPAEVGAFLSIASKAAALGLLVRLVLAFSSTGLACEYLVLLLSLMAAMTCTFGNLAAYGQTNMKRLLAYSTIAHAGYMLMPVVAAVALVDAGNTVGARTAIAALAFYIAVYVFMNLGAFASVAFLRNTIGSEEIADYAALIHRSPGMAICLSIVLFSLLGMPPLAGFAAKFTIFAELFHAFAELSNPVLLILLVIGGLNTVLSLFYYLRVVKVMILSPVPDGQAEGEISVSFNAGLLCVVVALVLVMIGIWWDRSFSLAGEAVSRMLMY